MLEWNYKALSVTGQVCPFHVPQHFTMYRKVFL